MKRVVIIDQEDYDSLIYALDCMFDSLNHGNIDEVKLSYFSIRKSLEHEDEGEK